MTTCGIVQREGETGVVASSKLLLSLERAARAA